MPWILLLLAIACFVVPFLTTSVGLGVLCVLLALAFLLFGMMALISSRIQSNSRTDTHILTAEEMRTLREHAEAQRQAAARSDSAPPPGTPPA